MISYNAKQRQPKSYMYYALLQAAIAGLIFFAVLAVLGGGDSDSASVGFTIGFIVFLIAAIFGILSYLVVSFVPTDQDITINTGIIIRQSKTIGYGRIQNVNNSRGPVQMLFGLTTVNIWTASQGQLQSSTPWNNGVSSSRIKASPEGKLVLLRQDAEDLKAHMANKGAVQQVAVVTPVAAVPTSTPPTV